MLRPLRELSNQEELGYRYRERPADVIALLRFLGFDVNEQSSERDVRMCLKLIGADHLDLLLALLALPPTTLGIALARIGMAKAKLAGG